MNCIILFQTLASTYPDGENGINMKGIEVVEFYVVYYYHWLQNFLSTHLPSYITQFHTYSWQVKTAALLLIVSAILLVFLMVRLYLQVRNGHKRTAMLAHAKLAYGSVILKMLADERKWEDEQIAKELNEVAKKAANDPEVGKWYDKNEFFPEIKKVSTASEMMSLPPKGIMIQVIMSTRLNPKMVKVNFKTNDNLQFKQELRDEEAMLAMSKLSNPDHLYLPNILQVCQLSGVLDFYEQLLVERKRVMQTLQEILTLTLPISEGYLAIYTSHDNKDIRYMARMCYVFCTKSDPYRFLEEDLLGDQPLWYPMMMHRMFGWLKQAGRQMPKFIYLAGNMPSAKAAAFLIREIAWWGSDQEKKEVKRFILSEHPECREAAIEVITKLKNSEAEDTLIESFEDQPEYLRRRCIQAIFALGAERHVRFFADAFKTTYSQQTKLCALDCLLHAGDEGYHRFHELRNKALHEGLKRGMKHEEALKIFDQVMAKDVIAQTSKL